MATPPCSVVRVTCDLSTVPVAWDDGRGLLLLEGGSNVGQDPPSPWMVREEGIRGAPVINYIMSCVCVFQVC